MSFVARKIVIQEELAKLRRQEAALKEELKSICDAERKAKTQSFAGLPRKLEELADWWRRGKIDRDQIRKMHDFLCDLTFRGENVNDYTEAMLADIEDCMARIYFDLQSGTFKGPFRYDDEEADREADKWEKTDSAFCVFAK